MVCEYYHQNCLKSCVLNYNMYWKIKPKEMALGANIANNCNLLYDILMPCYLYIWKSIWAFILMNQVCLDMGSFLLLRLDFLHPPIHSSLQLWLSSDLPSSELTVLLRTPMVCRCFPSTCSFYSVVHMNFLVSFIFILMPRKMTNICKIPLCQFIKQ